MGSYIIVFFCILAFFIAAVNSPYSKQKPTYSDWEKKWAKYANENSTEILKAVGDGYLSMGTIDFVNKYPDSMGIVVKALDEVHGAERKPLTNNQK